MSGSALLTLYRSLTRHRLYAVLNIGGLALGVAVFLVLFLFVQFERGYDRVLPGWNRVWVINTQYDLPGFSTINLGAPADFVSQIAADFPGVTGVRLNANEDVPVRNGATVTSETVTMVDPGFFTMFPFPVVQGDPAGTVARPDGAVVTQEIAHRYLGDTSPVGKMLTITIDGQPRAYQVGAVLKNMPADMTYTSGIFLALPPRVGPATEGDIPPVTFLDLPNADAARALERQLPAFIDRHPPPGVGTMPSGFLTMHLLPLSAVHLILPRDRAVVATLGLVGLLTLLIAIVNYVNLATARAGLRAREVALRKVLGGTRRSLIAQFLAEALATVAIAALVALAIAELALPFVNSIGGTSLTIHYGGAGSILFPLAMLILMVGGLAGLYPAFVLSGFSPAGVLASARTPGGGKSGTRLRQAMVVVQFAIAIAFTIGTAVLVAQTAHLRAADLGFRRDGLIMVPSFLDNLQEAQRADLLRAFAAIPGVTGIGRSRAAPGGGSFNISNYKDDKGGPTITVQNVDTGPGFFTTYGAHLLAGRLFDRLHAGDDAAGMSKDDLVARPRNVVVNATALKMLGFASPANAIGKPALKGQHPPMVVGVIDDMRFMSPLNPVQATLYTYNSRATDGMVPTLRVAPDQAPDVTRRIERTWRRIAADVPFRSMTVDQQLYDLFYKADAQRAHLFTIGAVLAVLIGCIGLYGLASFDTARRVKEIGIRKTLGASTRDILKLLIGQFLRPVLIANLIAWPIAYFAMRQWLSGFDDRVALSPLFFIAASVVAIAIATLTVIGQAWRVARAEPARALRHE